MSKRVMEVLQKREEGLVINLDPLGEISRSVPRTVSEVISCFSLPVVGELVFFRDPEKVLSSLGKARFRISERERQMLQLMSPISDAQWSGLRYEWRLRKRSLSEWNTSDILRYLREGVLPIGVIDRAPTSHLYDRLMELLRCRREELGKMSLSRDERLFIQTSVLESRRPQEIKALSEKSTMLLDEVEDSDPLAELCEEDDGVESLHEIVVQQGQQPLQSHGEVSLAEKNRLFSQYRDVIQKMSLECSCPPILGDVVPAQVQAYEDAVCEALAWCGEPEVKIRTNVRCWLSVVIRSPNLEFLVGEKLSSIYYIKGKVFGEGFPSVSSGSLMVPKFEMSQLETPVSAIMKIFPQKLARQLQVPIDMGNDQEGLQEREVIGRKGRMKMSCHSSLGFRDVKSQFESIDWDQFYQYRKSNLSLASLDVQGLLSLKTLVSMKEGCREIMLSMGLYPSDVFGVVIEAYYRLFSTQFSNPHISSKEGPAKITQAARDRSVGNISLAPVYLGKRRVCLFQLQGGSYSSLKFGQARMGISLYFAVECVESEEVFFRVTHSVPSADWTLGQAVETLPFIVIVGPQVYPIRSAFVPQQFDKENWRVFRTSMLHATLFSGSSLLVFWLTIKIGAEVMAVPFRIVGERKDDGWKGVYGWSAWSELAYCEQRDVMMFIGDKKRSFTSLGW